MTRTAPLEKDIAALVVEDFRSRGWEVYQEVAHESGRIADIVAISPLDGRVHVVECKARAGLEVHEQARFWRGRAAHSSVAVPRPSESRRAEHFALVCREFGIGLFYVGTQVRLIEHPVYDGVAGLQFRLTEGQKTATAGTSEHEERATKKGTRADAIRDVVDAHPHGIPLLDLIDLAGLSLRKDRGGVDQLRKEIQKSIDGVEVKKRGGEWFAVTTAALYGRV